MRSGRGQERRRLTPMRIFGALLRTCLAVLIGLAAGPSLAAKWVELGNVSNSLDKVFVDIESIQQVDEYRIVPLMTVYPSQRLNKANIVLDRHIQKTAIDCGKRLFFGIQTIGFLGSKQVGTSPEELNWKLKLIPLPNEALTDRILANVCGTAPPGQAVGINAPPGSAQPSKLSSGSGIVLNRAGNILTNAHVVNGCKSIAVKPYRGDPLAGKIEAIDPKSDLAVISLPRAVGRVAQFRPQSAPAKLGESVGVVGYPLTGILSTEPKATFGQVTSVAGMNNDYSVLQISAPIQPGNSGAPVFDGSGAVIGVVVSEASAALIAKIGVVPQNINFAIRGEIAQIFLQAHGIKLAIADAHPKLETEALAQIGQETSVLILCAR